MVSNQVDNPEIEIQEPPSEAAASPQKVEKTVKRRSSTKSAEKKEIVEKTGDGEKSRVRTVKNSSETSSEKLETLKKEPSLKSSPAKTSPVQIKSDDENTLKASRISGGEGNFLGGEAETVIKTGGHAVKSDSPQMDDGRVKNSQSAPPSAAQPFNNGQSGASAAAANNNNYNNSVNNNNSSAGSNNSGNTSSRPNQNNYRSNYSQNRFNDNNGSNYYKQSGQNNPGGGQNNSNATVSGSPHNFNQSGPVSGQQNTQCQNMPQHQYVEMARGFTIQDLNKKSIAELFQIAQELDITPQFHKRINTLIMRIMHEQIKRAGGYAAEGVLDILEDGYGFLRTATYSINEKDVYVSPSQIRRFDLRTGDVIIGQTRAPKEGEKFAALLRIEAINFEEPEKIKNRKTFDTLVPCYPTDKFTLEKKADYGDLSTRIVDLMSPVGKGQRGLIVAPPKAGKTTLLKSVANSLIENHPEVEVMILLIDERPEEVTDMQRSVNAEVISSTFDEPLEHHIKVSELTLEKAKRMVENNKHVVILLDSITRLARAYNLHLPSSGQTLTGGVNPAALYKPKKFFGAARNIEGGGSLTILATALVETGSKLDDIIFEEFKGTGNMELILDRKLFEKRLFPCMDIKRTGTRKEELLLDKDTLNRVWILRKILEPLSPAEAMQLMVDRMSKTKRNKDFLESMHVADAN